MPHYLLNCIYLTLVFLRSYYLYLLRKWGGCFVRDGEERSTDPMKNKKQKMMHPRVTRLDK